ncbi:hypothetical protein [Mycobacterium sp.]|uniref:hypothetical protein n=1 Tax=Mycobacterium sp. TaxID=1785 RepID=UPI003A8AD812
MDSAPTNGVDPDSNSDRSSHSFGARIRMRSLAMTPFAGWLSAVIAVGTLVRIPQLFHRLNEMHSFRQTQTAYVALEYARRGINPLHTPLPIFGPDADVPMECPLPQAAAAVLIRLGLGSDAAMRIIGLIGFQAAAVLLAVLVFRWHGRLTALVVVVLYEFSPFGLAWGAAALIDFPAVALALGMVVGLDSWFRTASNVGLLTGSICAWMTALVKATTLPAWCVLAGASALAVYLTTRSLGRVAMGILAGPAVAVAVAMAWVRYGDSVKIQNPSTVFLTSENLRQWNFGTLGQRSHWAEYEPVLTRISDEIVGLSSVPPPLPLAIFGLLAFVVFGILAAPTWVERIRRAGWLGVAASAPMLFFNLYQVHSYYLIAVFPAIVAVIGLGIVEVARRIRGRFAVALCVPVVFFNLNMAQSYFWTALYPAIISTVTLGTVAAVQRLPRQASLVALAGVAFVVTGSAAPQNLGQWTVSPQPDAGGERLRAATRPDDLILVANCDWDPTTLYYADRRGLMLTRFTPDAWRRADISAYSYVYSCDPTAAVQQHLPPGYRVIPTSTTGLQRLVRASVP